MFKTTLAATLLTQPSISGEELAALPETIQWLEVRADLAGDIDPDWLRNHFKGKLLYTLRSEAEGGQSADSASERLQRLVLAARRYDLVDLEAERDLSPAMLAAIPASKRLIYWSGTVKDSVELSERASHLSSVEATFYKLLTKAVKAGDELAALSMLKSARRSDVISYATGAIGFWTRLLAPRLGSAITFGVIGNGQRAAGEPDIMRLIEDYGLPELPPVEELYGIAGNPVAHSLSPRLHNAAYRALNHAALFVPFQVESFDEFWREVAEGEALASLGITIKGLTVASPYKEVALEAAGRVSHMARRAGATNILSRTNGYWSGDTTDPVGVLKVLGDRDVETTSRRAAVIGCGGAGRAVAAALDRAGAQVTLVNRGAERGQRAVELLGLPFVRLSEFDAEGFDILVNATPMGRDDDEVPFAVEGLKDEAVVVDFTYGSRPTPLVTKALGRGLVVIDGREVLLAQVLEQFRLMTGREMPEGLALRLLGCETGTSSLVHAR